MLLMMYFRVYIRSPTAAVATVRVKAMTAMTVGTLVSNDPGGSGAPGSAMLVLAWS